MPQPGYGAGHSIAEHGLDGGGEGNLLPSGAGGAGQISRAPSGDAPVYRQPSEEARQDASDTGKGSSYMSNRSTAPDDPASAWYAGSMRRNKCEEAVCASIHGAFLVRQSSGDKTNYVVCVNDHGKPMHFQVQGQPNGQFAFAGNAFSTLQGVVTFLQSQTLHGKSGSLLKLTAPAPAGKFFTPPVVEQPPLRRQASTAAGAVARFAAQRSAAASTGDVGGAILRSESDNPQGPGQGQGQPGAAVPRSNSAQPSQYHPQQQQRTFPAPKLQHQPPAPPIPHYRNPSDADFPEMPPANIKPRRRSLSVGHDPRHVERIASVVGRNMEGIGRPSWMVAMDSDPLNDSSNSGYGNEDVDQDGAPKDSGVSFMNDEELGDLRDINDGVGQLHTALSLGPKERNASDHARIATEMLSFHLFAAMSEMLRLRMCQLLEHAEHKPKVSLVPADAKIDDWWWAVISGEVVVQFGPESGRADMIIREGNEFGNGKNHEIFGGGTFVSGKDGCQTVKVAQLDYHRLHADDVKDTRHFMQDGKSVLITERQQLPSGEQCPVIVEGAPSLLINALLDQEMYDVFGDTTYTDVFLMAFRTFTDAGAFGARLLDAASDPLRTARVVAIATAWASQHPQEFLVSAELVQLLYRIEVVATSTVLQCNLGDPVKDGIAKLRKCRKEASVERTVIILRKSGAELGLKIRGGTATLRDIFVAKIFEPSCAADAGLLVGDRILSCNGVDFKSGMTHRGAVDAIKGAPARCSMQVVYDPTSMMLPTQAATSSSPPPPTLVVTDSTSTLPTTASTKSSPPPTDASPDSPARGRDEGPAHLRRSATIGGRPATLAGRRSKSFSPEKPVGRSSTTEGTDSVDDGGNGAGADESKMNWGKVKKGIFSRGRSQSLHSSNASNARSQSLSGGAGGKRPSKFKRLLSRTNSENSTVMKPKLDKIQSDFDGETHCGLRVHRGLDHGSRFVAVERSSSPADVAALLLAAWKLTTPHSLYVFMISGTSGPMAFSKVPDDQLELGAYLDASGRYYLVEDFAESDVAFSVDALRDFESSHTINSLIDVNPRDIARFITMRDANLFSKIPPLEYVTYLWTKSADKDAKCPNIAAMTNWFNHIRNWVIYEVLSEKVIKVRVEVLRRLIKVARACLTVKNLNGLFAVISGLSATPVSRQKATWEKLSKRYTELYAELEQLMDPSRNMSRYRYLLASSQEAAPWIPFFPMLMKDIDFLHEGNKSKTKEGLVNFEKCRMLSRIIMQHGGAQLVPYNAACMFPKKETKPKDAKAAWLRAQIGRSIEVRILRSTIPFDDEAQMEMSFECEPSRRKRHSSMSAAMTRPTFPASKTLEDVELGGASSTDANDPMADPNYDPRANYVRSSSAPTNLGGLSSSAPTTLGGARRRSAPMDLVDEEGGGTGMPAASLLDMDFEDYEAALGNAMRERVNTVTMQDDTSGQRAPRARASLSSAETAHGDGADDRGSGGRTPGAGTGQIVHGSPPLQPPPHRGQFILDNVEGGSSNTDGLQTPIPQSRQQQLQNGTVRGDVEERSGVDGGYASPAPRPRPRPRSARTLPQVPQQGYTYDPLATPLNEPLPPDPTFSGTPSPALSPRGFDSERDAVLHAAALYNDALRRAQPPGDTGGDSGDELDGFSGLETPLPTPPADASAPILRLPSPPRMFADDAGSGDTEA